MDYNALDIKIIANVAQLVEHPHGKGEVTGSIPVIGSRTRLFADFTPFFNSASWRGRWLKPGNPIQLTLKIASSFYERNTEIKN